MDRLKISGSSFKGVLDSLYDGLYVLNREGKIVYWNRSAERLTGFRAEEVLGCCCSDNILVHVDGGGNSICHNGCPMAATLEDGLPREMEVYLHHKSGHRVPVLVRTTALFNESGEIVGSAEIFSDNSRYREIAEENQRLRDLALIDELTQVGNRRYGEARLVEMASDARRYGWTFGAVFVDVDHFKECNDDYGHDVGDLVLRMVAQTLRNSLRSSDFVCRWGGEEFLCIIKNIGLEELSGIAEKFRVLVQESMLQAAGRTIRVTVSVGGSLGSESESWSRLVARADRAMYESKRAGRNRVTILPPPASFAPARPSMR